MLRTIMVCVDFSDILAVTLPRNRHHFSEVMVVTTPVDEETIEVARANDATVYTTTSFYADGAWFAKWKALEEGLDAFGREDWLTLMDCDILWPQEIPDYPREVGKLYTPLRRMMTDLTQPVPPESEWGRFPLHRNFAEWAGYSQTFFGGDPHLGPPPWHDVRWKSAGGADSAFQAKWPPRDKIRPPFEVLHLGSAGTNWCGRVTPYLSGGTHPEAGARAARLREMMAQRRRAGPGRFEHEKM